MRRLFPLLCAFLALGISGVALVGHVARVVPLYRWGWPTESAPMAFNTAVSVFLVSLSTTIYGVRRLNHNDEDGK